MVIFMLIDPCQTAAALSWDEVQLGLSTVWRVDTSSSFGLEVCKQLTIMHWVYFMAAQLGGRLDFAYQLWTSLFCPFTHLHYPLCFLCYPAPSLLPSCPLWYTSVCSAAADLSPHLPAAFVTASPIHGQPCQSLQACSTAPLQAASRAGIPQPARLSLQTSPRQICSCLPVRLWDMLPLSC